MTLFNGNHYADDREQRLRLQLEQLASPTPPAVAAILFQEDQGSQLYTRLKKEAAERVGMRYDVYTFSMRDEVSEVRAQLEQLNQDPAVTGIIIQKPWRRSWQSITGRVAEDFLGWWHILTQAIEISKDVDGLHPQTLAAIRSNTWQSSGLVLPATCQAVLNIMEQAQLLSPNNHVIILGKSDILGQPLFYQLQNMGISVQMIGSQELQERRESGQLLLDADVVISATGRKHLITGDLLKFGVAVIDVGEPSPDVEYGSVSQKAKFLTPVPGGVGPVTVICLLENTFKLFTRA